MILSNTQAAAIQYRPPHGETRRQAKPQPMMLGIIRPDVARSHQLDKIVRVKSPRRDDRADFIVSVRRLNPIAVRLIAHGRIKCRHHNGMARVHRSASARPSIHIITNTVLETASVHCLNNGTHHINEVTGSA